MIFENELIEDDDGTVFDALREGTLQSELFDFRVQFDCETAGFGTECDATVSPYRITGAAGASATEAFLFEGLLAAAGDFGSGFGRSSSSAEFGKITDDRIVDRLCAFVEFKVGIIERVIADFFTLDIEYVNIKGLKLGD